MEATKHAPRDMNLDIKFIICCSTNTFQTQQGNKNIWTSVHVQHGFIVKLVIKTWIWLMRYQISIVVKCRFKSSCPGSPHTFSMSGAWAVGFNRLQYESLWIMKSPLFQTTHLELMCKWRSLQAVLFCMSHALLFIFGSQSWTTVQQYEEKFGGSPQWWCGRFTCTVGHHRQPTKILFIKRMTVFTGQLCVNVKGHFRVEACAFLWLHLWPLWFLVAVSCIFGESQWAPL